MARRSGRRQARRAVTRAAAGSPSLISEGHRGVPCCGDPTLDGLMNTCPSPATSCLVTPGLLGSEDDPELGWIVMAFCDRHRKPVLDFTRPRVGPLGDDAIVAEIAALPTLLREIGIDAAIEGLDEGVLTNVFQPRRVG
jgi:hypothetical protein